jgi:sugar phosphate isomerase/epimerase
VAGLDIVDVYRRYRDKLMHVHLSNNAGKGWDSHLPVYAENGILDVGTFLDTVARDGFSGSIALELDLRPWIRDEEALTEVLVRNREFSEAALGLQPAGR